MVFGDFVNTTRAPSIGFIAMVYTDSDDDANFYYGIRARFSDELNANVTISCLSEYTYRVSVFSLQENGLPFNRSVDTASSISDISRKHDQQLKINFIIKVLQSYYS